MLPRLGGALGPLLLAAARGALPGGQSRRGSADAPRARPSGSSSRGGLPGRPESRRRDRRARGARRRARSSSTPARRATADGWTTNGGRVLTVVGRGADLAAAARAVAERRPTPSRSRAAASARHRRASVAGACSVAMIPRYTLPEMGAIWSDAARFEAMLRVELAVARAQSARGQIPPDALAALETRAPGRRRSHPRDRADDRPRRHRVRQPGRRVGRARGPLPPPRADQQRRRRHRARPPAPRRRRAPARSTATACSRCSSPVPAPRPAR